MRILTIVIPCYKDGRSLRGTLQALDQMACDHLSNSLIVKCLVVDDGSNLTSMYDDMGELRLVDVTFLFHPLNLGQGAALQTGFEYCRRFIKPDLVVTMDADGQHSPEDLPNLVKNIDSNGVDIVFGNRFNSSSNVPRSRAIILKLATLFERFTTKLALQDAHNGYRIFNSRALNVMHLKQNRMAHATEIKQIVHRHGLKYAEAPVSIQYTAETLVKGQSNSGAFLILRDLLKSYLFELR